MAEEEKEIVVQTPDEEFESSFEEAMNSVPGMMEPTAAEVETQKVIPAEEEVVVEEEEEDTTDWKAEFEREKQKTRSWEGRISAANEKTKLAEREKADLLAELETAKSTSKSLSIEVGVEDRELMESFPIEYPDLHKAFTIIATTIATEKALEIVNAKLPDLAPIEAKVNQVIERSEVSAESAHIAAIAKAHPDYREVAQSDELSRWILGHPAHKRGYLMEVYEEGNTQDVIDLFTDFKKSTSWVTKPSKKETSTTNTTKTSKLESMLGVQGDSTPLREESTESVANDFDAAFKEASSAR